MLPLNLHLLRIAMLAAGVVVAPVALSAATTGQPNSPSPVGRWLTGPNGGVIEINRCNGAAALCGRFVGITLDHPNDPEPTDVHGRPLCGLTILSDAEKSGPNEWTGHITDPRDGKTYHARLWLDEFGQLHMRGYVGLPLFGETVIWQPFQGRIAERCVVVERTTSDQRAGD